jgi:diguanylate cyclase (GGDEF)-like protein
MGEDHLLLEIEAALRAPSPRAFAPALESLYELREGPQRRLRLAVGQRVGAAGIMTALALDLANNGLARLLPFLGWRTALAVACLAAARLLPRATRPWQETLAYGLPTLGIVLVTERLGQLGPATFADRYMIAAAVSGLGMLAVPPVGLGTGRLVAAGGALLFPAVPILLPGSLPLAGNWDLPIFACGTFGLAAFLVRRNVQRTRTAFLQTLRHEISAAELTLLNAKLLRAASEDWLTRLPNRRSFEAAVERLWRDRRGPGLGLAMIDVDRFKAFNDAAGHDAGDACLRRVAELISGVLRGEEQASRYGGEEFAVLIPCGRADLAAVGERLRLAVEQAAIPHPGLGGAPVTISVGLAWSDGADRSGDRPSDLVRQADEALYEAKRNGRNRVATAATGDAADAGCAEIEAAAPPPRLQLAERP